MKGKSSFALTISFLIAASLIMSPARAVWTPDTPLPVNTTTFWEQSPSTMQAQDGKIWVAYTWDKDGSEGEIYYVTFDGSSWSSAKRLTTNTVTDNGPAIFQAKNGTIWLVWESDEELNMNIYYKTSSDNGESWSTDKILTTHMDDDYRPAITQAANGTIWVVWVSTRTGDNEIWYKTYNSVTKWSTERQLTHVLHNGDSNLAPTIFQMTDGKIWVVWHSAQAAPDWRQEIYYMKYDGSSWSSESVLVTRGTPGLEDAEPSVIQASEGTIWLVWHSNRGGQYDIYQKTSTNYGSSWSPETRLTTSSYDDESPSIINTKDGKLWLVWSKYLLNWDLYYKNSDLVHDVAITSVTSSSTKVYQGEIVKINVTAENQGTQNETFSVTVYANSTIIATLNINLNPETSIILPFDWNTAAFARGNYTVKASASIVPHEDLSHQSDNNLTYGIVRVKLIGDINDDGKVDVFDLAAVGRAFGSRPGDPLWDPEADFDRNGLIDVYDLATVGKNFGKLG